MADKHAADPECIATSSKKVDIRSIVPIAIDIEATGFEPHCKVISVGMACVYPDGNSWETALFTMPVPRFPETASGMQVVLPQKIEGAWTGVDAGIPAGQIANYGDFDEDTWSFWTMKDEDGNRNIDALIANIDWSRYEEKAGDENDVWVDVMTTIDTWCVDILERGYIPRIVSDNPSFDIGVCNEGIRKAYGDSKLTRAWAHSSTGTQYYQNWLVPPRINNIPMELNGTTVTSCYNTVKDLSIFTTAAKMGWIQEEEPLVKCTHNHRADVDALSIASRYAAYARNI